MQTGPKFIDRRRAKQRRRSNAEPPPSLGRGRDAEQSRAAFVFSPYAGKPRQGQSRQRSSEANHGRKPAGLTSLGRQSRAAMEGRADADRQAAARIEKGSKGRPQRDSEKAQRQAAGQMYRVQVKSPGNSPGRAEKAKHGRQPEAQKRRRKPGRPTAARKCCTCSDSFALC